jgi:DNA-binding response OmpR family regulator
MNSKAYKRILIVDDEAEICTLLRRIFAKLKPDYQVVTAPDGLSAIDWLMRQGFDLVLTDWQLGHIDGLELAKAIRNIWPDTRILLMTGAGTSELNGAIKSLGLNGWIKKPFSPSHVLNIVEKVMS